MISRFYPPLALAALFLIATLAASGAQKFSNPNCELKEESEISANSISYKQKTGRLFFQGDVVLAMDDYCLITDFVDVTPSEEDPSILQVIEAPNPFEMYIKQEDEFKVLANAVTYRNENGGWFELRENLSITVLGRNVITTADAGHYFEDTKRMELMGNVELERTTKVNPLLVQSDKGFFNTADDIVEFRNNVKLTAVSDNLVAWAGVGQYYGNNQTIHMRGNVVVIQQTEEGPGRVEADKAIFRIDENIVQLEGNVDVDHPLYPRIGGRNQVTLTLDD